MMKYITVVDVKNYSLCPMIAYYNNVLHIYERVTETMELGKEIHDEGFLSHLIPKLKAVKVLRNIELTSGRLGLTGKVDYVFVTRFNEYVPADAKWSDPEFGGAQRHHKAQLAAYSILIEEVYRTVVKRAVIYYVRAKKTVEVPITDSLKHQVEEEIRKIYRMIKTGNEPRVRINPKKCGGCNYQVYCKAKTIDRTLKLRMEKVI